MESRKSLPHDFNLIEPHLAKRMIDEYALAKVSPEMVGKYFRHLIGAGQATTFMSNGVVLAVLAWEVSDGAAHTSFAAVEEYFHPTHVRYLKRYLRAEQERLGNLPLVSNSYSTHPSTEKWFTLLGFTKILAAGVHRVFRLDPV